MALELHEEQRDAVHEAHEVGSAVVHAIGAVDPHLLDGREPVCLRVIEVEHLSIFYVGTAVLSRHLHRDTVAQHAVLLLVGLQGRVRAEGAHERVYRSCAPIFIQPFVELNQSVFKLRA